MEPTAAAKTAYVELTGDDRQLGGRNLEFELDNGGDVAAVAQCMAEQAQRSLLLHTENLDPAIYDHAAFIEALGRLARSHAQARVWILVQDSGGAVRAGHRLIELSRRLSTAVRIRRPSAEYRTAHESFLLADDCGYLHRGNPNRFEGVANFNDPARVARLRKYFTEAWERSEPDPEIQRLHL